MNLLVNAEKFDGYPFQLCSYLVITKMVEQVPISCLDLFQHLWVRLKAYGVDRQVAAGPVQTVDHGGQAMTSWSCFLESNISYVFYFSSLYFFLS